MYVYRIHDAAGLPRLCSVLQCVCGDPARSTVDRMPSAERDIAMHRAMHARGNRTMFTLEGAQRCAVLCLALNNGTQMKHKYFDK
jgi:hypothetical protein